MHNSGNSQSNSLQSVDDRRLVELCKTHTDLSDSDIAIIVECSHTLSIVSGLEGCDVFIDCLTRDKLYAVVIAQYSPEPHTFYTRNIVGELMYRHNEPGVFRTLEIGAPSRELKAVVSENILIRQNVSAIKNPEGKILSVLIMERSLRDPITKDEPDPGRMFPAFSNAREMQNVAEHINDAVIRFDTTGISVYANHRAREIYKGLNYRDDIVGLHFENLSFGNYTFEEASTKGTVEHTEILIGQYILDVRYTAIRDDGEFLGLVIIIRDTTDEKAIEKELILKSAAIEEIHHRVKNNLQTIVSLIRLQARRIANIEVRKVCNEIISRIYSISLTHEIMAQNAVGYINIKDLLGRMVNSARGFFIPDTLDLEFKITGDNISVQSDVATCIAMIVNELIQNCIKHAFTDRAKGCVTVSISKGDVYSNITVADDGVGFNPAAHRSGSLGHKLVSSLVKDKLRGNVSIHSSRDGTVCFFDFLPDGQYLKK